MSVVGFDLGNESCIIAVARRRGIDVLQNETGARKTKSMVAYGEKNRSLGDECISQFSGNFKNSLLYFKNFLATTMDMPGVKLEAKHVSYKTIGIGNRVGFDIKYEGRPTPLLPEQVTAAMFQKLKTIAELGLESKVSDCVIGVPMHWDDQQRRGLLDSAKIAGLNVLRLMNETTAVALNYGILRPLDADIENKVLFVDMGISQTSASVVSFQAGKLKVLSSAHAAIGGRDFDQLLMEHFAKHIKETYKMDVWSEPKAVLKLRKECQRVKLVLSANQKVNFNVEYIMNDTDVTGSILRSDWEPMVRAAILETFLGVATRALEGAKVDKADLFSCEIVGGSMRMPILQTELEAFIGKPLSKTCDSDESIARGCCWQCAMLSPSFRVREFEVEDATANPIELLWGPVNGGEEDIEDKTTIFEAFNTIPSIKMISFKDRVAPFQITARYTDSAILREGVDRVIGKYIVSGMPEADPNKPVPKIKVRVKLNIHGIVDVSQAQVLFPVEDEPEAEAEAEKADAAAAAPAEGEAGAEKPKEGEEAAPAADAAAAAEGETAPADAADAKMDTEEDKPKEKEGAEKKEEKKEEKKKVRRENLRVVANTTGGLDEEGMKLAFEKEAQMWAQDRAIFETNEIKNKLESYVLEMRSDVEGDLSKFMKEDAASKFCSQMTAMEDWLYEDGENAQKSEYKKKLAELKKIGDPVEFRNNQHSRRDEHLANLQKEIDVWENLAATKEEKYAHITEEDRTKVKDEAAKFTKWIADEIKKQEKLALYEDPSLTTKILDNKKYEINKFAKAIMMKAKPAPPKPKEEPKKEAKKKDADAKPEPAANGDAMPEANGDAKPEEAAAGDENQKPAAEETAKADDTKKDEKMDTAE